MRGGSDGAAAPRALFLHGAGAWGGQWAIWRRVFEAAGWVVDSPDLQRAPDGLAATRLEDYVTQALQAFERLRDDSALATTTPPIIVGASLGGLLALAAAARCEAQGGAAPRALVLVNPLPPAPWSRGLPAETFEGEVVPWHAQGRFHGTVRALPTASFADRELAFRHWRDESAAVVREARAGVALAMPSIATVVLASDDDAEIPPTASASLAEGLGASLLRVPGSHVEPVMGASAAPAAGAALAWLEATLSAR